MGEYDNALEERLLKRGEDWIKYLEGIMPDCSFLEKEVIYLTIFSLKRMLKRNDIEN